MMKKHTKMTMKKLTRNIVFTAMLAAAITPFAPKSANACCECAFTISSTSNAEWPRTQALIENRVTTEFSTLETWYTSVFWEDNILPAMMLFADQMSAVANYQTAIFATFLDAKNQLETQRTLQKIKAQTNKDYQPSEGMCEIGSTTRSLAASERKSELTAHVLSQSFQDRILGNANSAAAGGNVSDKAARIKQFREKFCDPTNNNAGLDYLCEHDQDGDPSNNTYRSDLGATDNLRMNKDIDYVRTVEFPWTLNIDFTNATLTEHEEDVLALADNLYGYDVFQRMTGALADKGGIRSDDFEAIHRQYLDARAVLAKLNVAKNSFDSIVSMKANGTAGARDYMKSILNELGIQDGATPDNFEPYFGKTVAGSPDTGPSYNAQMEVLTKKIYQNPDFYTNLYDKPANVERKKVAMQAIGLMQKFDMFKSYLRYEANLSVLLELAVVDLQEKLEQEISDQSRVGEN